MKKFLLIPLLALALVGCSSEAKTAFIPDESTYISMVRKDGGVFATKLTDGELLQLGYAACEEFAQGYTVMDILDSVLDDYDDIQTRTFLPSQLAASAIFLCNDIAVLK